MTVKELLNAYYNKDCADVVIIDESVDDIVAIYKAEDFNDWYLGQLDCTNSKPYNPLNPYFGYEVKHFTIIDTIVVDKAPTIYINI